MYSSITRIITCLIILLTVAFFTLFERKIMGRFHLRLGPNKISVLGLLQPLLDAIKLFIKAFYSPNYRNKKLYATLPIATLFLSIFIYTCIPMSFINNYNNYSLLNFIVLSSFRRFLILLGGWISNSKYTILGRLRRIAQTISYEIVFRTIIILIIALYCSYSISNLRNKRALINLAILPIWIICFLAETHRAPFDFREAESELVSGFNTEYRGYRFAFLFLREYIIILFGCVLIGIIFFIGPRFPISPFSIFFIGLLISFLTIWIRITFCRFRYDFLIGLAWKTLLPISLCRFFLIFFL